MVRFETNSDDFIFDNQMLVQCHAVGLRIAEVTCPTKYFEGASSINFQRSVQYGLGCLAVAMQFALHRSGITKQTTFTVKRDKVVGPVDQVQAA
jgi:hypothetical protein